MLLVLQISQPDSAEGGHCHIPYTELNRWTDNFNNLPVHSGGRLLGQGGYSHVFKGLTEIKLKLG